MSHHYYLQIDTGGKHMATVAELGNIFGTVYPVLNAALGFNFSTLDGRICEEVYDLVRQGVTNLFMPEYHEKIDDAAGMDEEKKRVAEHFLVNMLYQMWLNPKAQIYFS